MGLNFRDSALGLALTAGPVVKFVLLLLVLFSVISWAIIFYKWRVLRRAQRESRLFEIMFREAKRPDQLFISSAHLRDSPLAQIFREGYTELVRVRKAWAQAEGGGNPGHGHGSEATSLTNVARAIQHQSAVEVARLERHLTFLATTGSATPFIGLFGTVWGIMDSFRGIGAAGSASLAVVAPGISEALIATAVGLAVAIPAVIFYNYYVGRIKALASQMEGFGAEFLNLVERSLVSKG
ncbi:MAG: protein TolQ [Deltaproteobacteria bacterium]|nr:protein TolQ [Deltaproteobacteria bacterium]